MTLGELLRHARLEAGLSQKALCGDDLTRNMLSMIENGSAKPSMDTLRLLASRLGKPISYFLEEAAVSVNQPVLHRARQALTEGQYRQALIELEAYQGPDEAFDQEKNLLHFRILIALAEQSLGEGRIPYARSLLQQTVPLKSIYLNKDDERRRLLLLARAEPGKRLAVCNLLPPLDEELLLRAESALHTAEPHRAAALLDCAAAVTPTWLLLRGKAAMAMGDYHSATEYLHQAEDDFPQATAEALEQCYRELDDFRKAYHYVCKLRDLNKS